MENDNGNGAMEVVALPQETEQVVEQGESTRAERWRGRMQTASAVLQWLAPRARPAAEHAATFAKGAGRVAGSVIKTGGTVIGAGVAGVGLVAVGGPAGATVAMVGAGIGASSWIGGWFAEKVGEGTAIGFDIGGFLTEKTLHVSDRMLQGIDSLLTKTQAEVLLGDEGAAVLEHVMEIQQESRDVVADATYMQIVRGMVAYACLQRAMHVDYSNRGFVSSLQQHGGDVIAFPRGPAAFRRADRSELGSDEVEGNKELAEVLRHVEIAHAVYGAVHNALVGDGTAREVLEGNKAMVTRFLGLESEEDVVAAQWHSPGPHTPVFILVADRKHGALVLAIRGTMSSGDVLTDLRCRSGKARLSPESEPEAVHMGMWETAVRMDAELGEVVEEALAGPCKGMALRLTGHSLGAGVATLLALRWEKRFARFEAEHGWRVKCFAFAPPCTVSLRMARASQAAVTSLVLADDAVCRWSLGSTKDVLRAAASLGKEEGAMERLVRITLSGADVRGSWRQRQAVQDRAAGGGRSSPGDCGAEMDVDQDEEGVRGGGGGVEAEEVKEGSQDEAYCLSLLRTLDADMQEEKLYPAGRVLWMVKEKGGDERAGTLGQFRCVEREADAFGKLVFSRSMLSDHLIHKYDQALRALLS